MNFLQSIKAGTPTDEAHRNLLRFGTGTFKRETVHIRAGTQIQVAAGFEYYLTLFDLFLRFTQGDEISASGRIIGVKKQMQRIVDDLGIEPEKVFGKKFTLDFTASRETLKTLRDRVFEEGGFVLLNLTSGRDRLQTKTTFPKLGEVVEKFCKLKVDKSHKDEIQETFVIGDFSKKAQIEVVYDVASINFDEDLIKSDPAQARLESTRDLTVTRTITLDGGEPVVEEFSATV